MVSLTTFPTQPSLSHPLWRLTRLMRLSRSRGAELASPVQLHFDFDFGIIRRETLDVRAGFFCEETSAKSRVGLADCHDALNGRYGLPGCWVYAPPASRFTDMGMPVSLPISIKTGHAAMDSSGLFGQMKAASHLPLNGSMHDWQFSRQPSRTKLFGVQNDRCSGEQVGYL